jgi:hypothetical protein
MIFRSAITLLVLLQILVFVFSRAEAQSFAGQKKQWWESFPSSPLGFEPA